MICGVYMSSQNQNAKLYNEEERINPVPKFDREKALFVIFILLILAIIINLFPFQSLGLQTRMTGYPAIVQLANAGITAETGIIHRRGLYLALGEKAPDTNLLLPPNTQLDIAQLYGLGRVKNILYKKYDPESLFADVALSNYIVTGFNADIRLGPGPFRIAMGKEEPHTMVLLRRNNVWYLVDASLLPFE